MTHKQAKERECMAEDRAKGKRDDDRIERDEETIKRFLRGGFRGSLGGQLLTDDEHEVVCAHIEYLAREVADLRDGNEYILVRELREQVECLTQQLEAATKEPNLRLLHDNLMAGIATTLHSFVEQTNDYRRSIQLEEVARIRYQSDARFNAQVNCLVAQVMDILQALQGSEAKG